MRKPTAAPTNTERPFRINEEFFSCTNEKGTILAGNSVFQRVSGYSEAELVGSPHNLIRHPDMPKAVFRLFWETILAGEPIAAVVKNLAKDGAYYWVVALVAPTQSGFVSIRFKPSSPLLPKIVAIYEAMRSIERQCEERGEDARTAMDASGSHLAGCLASLGFPNYEAFMRGLLLREEIDARDAALRREQLDLLPTFTDGPRSSEVAGLLRDFARAGQKDLTEVERLYAEMSELVELDRSLLEKSKEAVDLSEQFSLVTMNIEIQAWRCGDSGRGIPVVAGHLSETAQAIRLAVLRVRKKAEDISTLIGHALFGVAWARLQLEMAIKHYHEVREESLAGEIKEGTPEFATRVLLVGSLAEAARRTHKRTTVTLSQMETALVTMGEESETMRRFMVSLMVSKVVGLAEAARLEGVDTLNAAFEDLKARVDRIQTSFGNLELLIEKLLSHAQAAPQLSRVLDHATSGLESNAAALGRCSRRVPQAEQPRRDKPADQEEPAPLGDLAAAAA